MWRQWTGPLVAFAFGLRTRGLLAALLLGFLAFLLFALRFLGLTPLGLFALALGKRRSAKASLVGLLGGLAMTLWIVFFKPSVGWPWLGVMTCSATVLVGRAALVITGPRDLTPAR